MAIVLKFQQGDSGTSLDLMDGADGFQLSGQGWSPAVATPVHMGDPAPIGESIHLYLAEANQDTIATSMQSLHEMQVLANRYINDPAQEHPVWLHAKMDNETGERRALVYRIGVQYKSSWFGPQATALDMPLVLTVVRGPYWESTSVRNLPDGAPSAAACVVYDYTAAGDAVGAHNIVGDVGARIRFFELLNNNLNFVDYWLGIRSAGKHGATGISNFEPIWECEDGGNFTDATDTVDATASGADRVTVSESGVDWDDGSFHNVLQINLDSVPFGNPEDLFGNYLWLLRSLAVSGTWEVRLNFRMGNYTTPVLYTDPVEVNTATWHFYEMGIMPISLYSFQVIIDSDFDKSNIDEYLVRIQARRTSGSGDLYLDCLVPVPIDEGFCKLSFESYSGTFTEMLGQSPHGVSQLVRRTSASETAMPGSIDNISNFILPPGDGRIYCVYQAISGPSIADTIVFNDGDTGKYYERWLSLRGNE